MRSEQHHKAGPRPPAGTLKSTTGLCGQTPGHQGHLQSLCPRPAESGHSRGPWVRAGGLSAEKGPNPEPPPHGTTTSPTPQLSMNVKSASLLCCPESSASTFPVALYVTDHADGKEMEIVRLVLDRAVLPGPRNAPTLSSFLPPSTSPTSIYHPHFPPPPSPLPPNFPLPSLTLPLPYTSPTLSHLPHPIFSIHIPPHHLP